MAMARSAETFVGIRYGLPERANVNERVMTPDGLVEYDGGADFVIVNGRTETRVDVKWSPNHGAALVARLDTVKAHVYVLVTGDNPDELVIRGYAWAPWLRRSVSDLGHGPAHVIQQDDLHHNVDLLFVSLGYPP